MQVFFVLFWFGLFVFCFFCIYLLQGLIIQLGLSDPTIFSHPSARITGVCHYARTVADSTCGVGGWSWHGMWCGGIELQPLCLPKQEL